MAVTLPRARLGVVLSSGNWPVETYFRAYAPATLGIHVTRMRMGSGGGRAPAEIDRDVLAACALVADVGVDVIDLQATGIVMERGPDGEAALVDAITAATGIPAYTASQAVVEGLHALGIRRLIAIGPYGEAAARREAAYLEVAGFSLVEAVGLDLGDRSAALAPEGWGRDGTGARPAGGGRRLFQRFRHKDARSDRPGRAGTRQACGHQRAGRSVGREAQACFEDRRFRAVSGARSPVRRLRRRRRR